MTKQQQQQKKLMAYFLQRYDMKCWTSIPVPARRSVSAESSVVPRAVPHLRLGVDVKEGTLFVVARV